MLALGFDHVSDDDFARVTIAQAFAHAPRLDPSGTSWLPFPFWVLGSVMRVAGRSLVVARVASIVLASVAAALPYVALRITGTARRPAMIALAFALLSPWSLWLGAATVPESVTASLTAAAVIGLAGGGASPRARVAFAVGLMAACLSRYETWPVAGMLAIVSATRGVRALRAANTKRADDAHEGRLQLVLAAALAAGPLLWMAWNVHAHGDALHFFQRVARFKRALGEGSVDTLDALLLYPRLFVTMRPDVVVAFGAALVAARAFESAREQLRARGFVPLACLAAQIAFLSYGNARDGAPAHHAERALLGTAFVAAVLAAQVLAASYRSALEKTRGAAVGGGAVLASMWLMTGAGLFGDVPGSGGGDDRRSQVAAGKRLRGEGADHLELTPCAYEHFALIAAYGAPERVTTRPSAGAPVVPSCPAVERR